MNVYRNYTDIMKKKLPFVVIYGAVFLLLLGVLSNLTQQGKFSRVRQQNVRIAVLDYDGGEAAKQLMAYLSDTCEIVEIEESWNERLDALYYRDVYYILTIPENYTEHFFNGEVRLECASVTGSSESSYVNELIYDYTNSMKKYHMLEPEKSLEQLRQKMKVEEENAVEVVQVAEPAVEEENVDHNAHYNLLGFILFACITSVVCSSMYAYRRTNIYRRHLISPVPEVNMNFQLLLGNMTYSYLYAIVFLALVVALQSQQNLSLNHILYWINALMYTTSILFFAYWISFRVRNKAACYLAANFGGFVLAFTGGVFFRQEYLSEPVVKLSTITPVYWFIRGNDYIMGMTQVKMADFLPLLKIFGIQLLFAGAFFSFVLAGVRLDSARK